MGPKDPHHARSEAPMTPTLPTSPKGFHDAVEENHTRLKPYSADDINPLPLFRQVTEWLQIQPMPPAGEQQQLAESEAAQSDDKPPPASGLPPPPLLPMIDLRQATRAQLAAAARRHNGGFNIGDPVSEDSSVTSLLCPHLGVTQGP